MKVAMPQQESSTWHDNYLVWFLLGLEYCNTGNVLEHFTVKIIMRCNYNSMLQIGKTNEGRIAICSQQLRADMCNHVLTA